jgi:ribonuclease HI
MELTACIVGLKTLKKPCIVDLFTDSKYVMDGMTKWIVDWEKKGWKTSNKKPVANVELWQELAEITKQHDIIWHWVKGHADDKYNNEADFLARKEADTL